VGLRNCFANEASGKKTPPKVISYLSHVPKWVIFICGEVFLNCYGNIAGSSRLIDQFGLHPATACATPDLHKAGFKKKGAVNPVHSSFISKKLF
jgi:hypothetical protein